MRQARSTVQDNQLSVDISILPALGPRMSFFSSRVSRGATLSRRQGNPTYLSGPEKPLSPVRNPRCFVLIA